MCRRLFTSIVLLLLSGILLYAAPSPFTQKRSFLSQVFAVLSKYEGAGGFYDQEDTREILRVFNRNRQATVFMDLMGHPSFGTHVTLGEYIDYVTGHGYTLAFDVSEVKTGAISREGELMILPVNFKKTVRYYDGNDVLFSPESYYRGPIELTAEFVYEPQNGNCYIREISGRVLSNVSPLPDKFTVIRRNRDDAKAAAFDSLLVAANNIPAFDAAGQAFYPGSLAAVDSWDSDVLVKMEEVPLAEKNDRYRLIRFNYKPVHQRLRFRGGVAAGSAYAVESPDDYDFASMAYEGAFEWGYAFQLGPMKLAPYIGLGLQFSSLRLDKSGVAYSYPMTDTQGHLVNRNYIIDAASTAFSFSDVFVPVYADFEFRAGKVVNIHARAGVKAYINMGTKISEPYSLMGSIDGTAFETTPQAFLFPVSYERNRWDVSFISGLDIDISVIRNKLSASLGVSYELGLTPSFSSDVTRWFDAQNQVLPLVYYAKQGEDVPFAPMISSLQYKRKALWLHLGLFKKF